MAVSSGENQLQRIIKDLQGAATDLNIEFKENGEPITDDSENLHKFSFKLEYLLQFDQKEKTTFLGSRKDYWDYFCDCLAKIKGANDGIRFVKSIPELKTSLGKGRAFIRYSLVHQRLADTLQQCIMNVKVTSDWYYARSPLVKPHLNSDIINHLYELNEVQFDVASRGHDLDSAWPTFARRTLGSLSSPAHSWKPPSRSSSISSLLSSYSQVHEFPSSPDMNSSLAAEQLETLDELRIELDQSDLKHKQMQERIQQLEIEKQELQKLTVLQEERTENEKKRNISITEENNRLAKMVDDLQKQCGVSVSTQNTIQELQKCLQTLELSSSEKQKEYQTAVMQLETSNKGSASELMALTQELETAKVSEKTKECCIDELKIKLSFAEQKNLELISRIEEILNEKGQQTANHYDSALKIHELLDKLNEAEKEKSELQKVSSEQQTQLEKLAQDLKERDAIVKEHEEKVSAFSLNSAEENTNLVEELEKVNALLQGNLTLKENETANLQLQLQDSSKNFELLEKQYEEELEEARQEKEESQKMHENTKRSFEEQLLNMNNTTRNLESQKSKLVCDKDNLNKTVQALEEKITKQRLAVEEISAENEKLQVQNQKLQQALKKCEGENKELVGSGASLETEVIRLKASEKQLQSQIDDAMVTVDEKEKKLRDENRTLDESLQNVIRQNKTLEDTLKKLQHDHDNLKGEISSLNSSLSLLQTEHRNAMQHVLELERNLLVLEDNEETLKQQATEQDSVLQEKESYCKQLLERLERSEKKVSNLEKEKLSLEKTCMQQSKLIESITAEKASVEKLQLEQRADQEKESQEINSRLSMTEKQLEVRINEVSRLQQEVISLRTNLQQATEDQEKCQDKLNLSERSLEEYRLLVEQLKEQIESLNRSHVEEVVLFKEREELLRKEKEEEACHRAELETSLLSLQQELSTFKQYAEKTKLENAETKDLLHRTNTEMAELGIQICALTSEKVDAKQNLAEAAARIQELSDMLVEEREKMNLEMCSLGQENESLHEKLGLSDGLASTVKDLQAKLDKAEKLGKNLQETTKEEISAIKFQMSTEVMNCQSKLKTVSEELEDMKRELDERQTQISSLEEQLALLQALKTSLSQDVDQKSEQVQNKDEEVKLLEENLERTQKELEEAQKQIRESCDKLEEMQADKDRNELKLLAELDDLNRTKTYLEERLIELIRDKDVLWQKSDALEFEQKLRAEERWLGDKEVNHCLDCKSQFTWWLRRHHCRLCGRIFCYYCCNNFAMTKHSGKKERCCRDCFLQHGAISQRISEPGSPSEESSLDESPLLQAPMSLQAGSVTDEVSKQDDAAFDIITDEELNQVKECDSLTQTEGQAQYTRELNEASHAMTPEEPSELMPVMQDAEICLLKSGELTLRLPLTVEDIFQFGESNKELFIKSSNYSVIPITVEETGLKINWLFSSDPKSISFSVVFQESAETPLEQCKVLIPLTRCNSHKETIQGQLKARHAGIYLLIFDNSFSKFISKKVLYHLAVERPVIYDGSDLP
ncbi:FYVE and coiled-coil domain-containing protein 1 isoform X2 [Latimeria chalumnae]|uniref:FYVE and coiled-coil domain-containing protein 1 isoform X2 n=1 Tax=Latimeria chalumnae TaxID=7897 RepID=UPI0006D913D6|nr:PREDICTED: FYVE and coiled-coil domain-containing protein 1 isoform X2 [Latimeria chalumnae]|eukprot:XP_006004156.2 PREDICTED: FYVE and coiled-coil domain-containing protein 1 isoform X2 [Latimeria chalumnae]